MDQKAGHSSDEYTLRAKARAVLQSGKVPARLPDRILGGLGSGKPCVVCDLLLTVAQMEIEVEFSRHDATSGVDTYHAHPRCFAAWELELRALFPTAAPSPNDRGGRLLNAWLAASPERTRTEP